MVRLPFMFLQPCRINQEVSLTQLKEMIIVCGASSSHVSSTPRLISHGVVVHETEESLAPIRAYFLLFPEWAAAQGSLLVFAVPSVPKWGPPFEKPGDFLSGV